MLKKAAVFFALLMLLVGLTPALAQDSGTLGLSEADFALYTQGNSYSFDSLAFDYSFNLSISQEALTLTGSGIGGKDANGNPVAQLTIAGGGALNGKQINVDLELRLVDNILYLLDNTGDQGWQGIPLEDALDSAGGEDLGIDPDALAEGDLGGLGSMFEDATSLVDSGFVQMARLADSSVNGVNAAHFQMTFDFNTLLSSDFLKNILVSSEMLSGTEEEIDQQFQFFASLLGGYFQGMTLSFDQYIGIDTPRLEQAALNFGMSLQTVNEKQETITNTIGLTFDLTMTEYNPAVSVEVPADVTMIDPEELEKLMQGVETGGF